MRSTVAIVILVLSFCAAVPARADLLREIDAWHTRGDISAETRHLYRVAALKDRDLLPPELRRLALGPERRRDGTRVMVEAMQWVIQNGAQGGPLQKLLAPPDDLANVLDSSTLPIRVTYKTGTTLAEAQRILTAAEQSWTIETESYGFYVPPIEPGFDRYRIYIDETGFGAGAYTSPYAEDPSTLRSDCFSYVVYDTWNPPDVALSTVAHELNHAMQSAMDCTEIWPFMENTSTYIELGIDPISWEYAYWVMEVFQSNPWRALDYNNYNQMDGYEYGGVLWALYLTTTFAPDNGPVFMRQVWEACIQNNFYNSKDYFEAITEVVAAAGGPDELAPVFADFTEARYFVGVDSDGEHIPGAASYAQCELTPAARFNTGHLPISGGPPAETKQPAPYGSNHIVLTLGGSYPYRLRVSFDGADETRWAVRVLLVGGGPTESLTVPLDGTSFSGSLDVDPAGRSKLVLMVANLATLGYTPNNKDWPGGQYTYRIEPIPPAPTLTALDPAEIEQGVMGVVAKLTGSGFVQGPEFAVTFDDPTLYVDGIISVADREVKLVIMVPAETTLGPKDLTVTNAGGEQAVGAGLLTVIAPRADAGTGGDGDGGGCGCASGRGPGPVAAVVLLALAVVLPRRGRRRR